MDPKLPSRRGRPRQHNDDVVSTIMSYKDEICIGEKIISKYHHVWQKISRDLNDKVSGTSLYTMVVNNRYDLRKLLFHDVNISRNSNSSNDSSSMTDNLDDSAPNEGPRSVKVDIAFTKRELEDLIMERQYSRTEKLRPKLKFRQYTVLQRGKWQLMIIAKLWEACRRACGYSFKRGKVFNNKIEITGKCTCGSVIIGKVHHFSSDDEIVIMTCEMTEGSGKCKKRPLRKSERTEVGKLLVERKMAADVYRCDRANELMDSDDTEEPPHLYPTQALRDAKKEYAASLCLDKDPVVALNMAMNSSLHNRIRNIILNPFCVHYWTAHQVNVYREYSAQENSSVAIDATGGIISPVIRKRKGGSKHAFLYICVTNSATERNISVSQMISTCQTTTFITFWLLEWVRSGAPPPKEVTCDSSKALLGAIVKTFTGHMSIDDYAAESWKGPQKCFVRIDVAHFIKGYANFVKALHPNVKRFYLSSLGQLILARNMSDAERILYSIFVIASSKTEGNLSNGTKTLCEMEKQKMKDLFTEKDGSLIPDPLESESTEDTTEIGTGVTQDEYCVVTPWNSWGSSIKDEATANLDDTGDRDNAHYFPEIVDRLMRDIKWFALWGNVCRDGYGYGRVPASSAVVESTFNYIKNHLFQNALPTRVDLFVERHLDYIQGRVKLFKKGATNTADDVVRQSSENIVNISNTMNTTDATDNETGTSIDEMNNNIEITHTDEIRDNIFVNNETGISIGEIKDNDSLNNETETGSNEINNTNEEACLICKNGDYPTGAHSCAVCEKFVHVLEPCSFGVDGEEEGYGEKRICFSCKKVSITDLKTVIQSKEIENWRGLGVSPRKKRSRYLQKAADNVFLVDKKISKIPMLKNGNSPGIMPVFKDGKKITVENTCAFDSIFQIFLSSYFDNEYFQIDVQSLAIDHAFFKMLVATATTGISKMTYSARAELLMPIFKLEEAPHKCYVLDCETCVSYLCDQLFLKVETIKEISSCNKGCQPRIKNFPTVSVQRSHLLHTDFDRLIENNFIIKGPKKCCQKKCAGSETTEVSGVGSFIILEVYDANGRIETTALHRIPKMVSLSFVEQPYHLRGIVHSDRTTVTHQLRDVVKPQNGINIKKRRRSGPIGHFTAMCRRRDDRWYLYDDTQKKCVEISERREANIQVAIYTK